VEIPSDREINDNIVAFWRPKDKYVAKGEYFLAYRLHWSWDMAEDPKLAKVTQARVGLSFDQKSRQFVIDFAGGVLKDRPDNPPPEFDLRADKGQIQNVTIQPMPGKEAWRLSFQLVAGGEKVIELRAKLLDAGQPISESWVYRWTA
jgi:glucans biosynthesis protein